MITTFAERDRFDYARYNNMSNLPIIRYILQFSFSSYTKIMNKTLNKGGGTYGIYVVRCICTSILLRRHNI